MNIEQQIERYEKGAFFPPSVFSYTLMAQMQKPAGHIVYSPLTERPVLASSVTRRTKLDLASV